MSNPALPPSLSLSPPVQLKLWNFGWGLGDPLRHCGAVGAAAGELTGEVAGREKGDGQPLRERSDGLALRGRVTAFRSRRGGVGALGEAAPDGMCA